MPCHARAGTSAPFLCNRKNPGQHIRSPMRRASARYRLVAPSTICRAKDTLRRRSTGRRMPFWPRSRRGSRTPRLPRIEHSALQSLRRWRSARGTVRNSTRCPRARAADAARTWLRKAVVRLRLRSPLTHRVACDLSVCVYRVTGQRAQGAPRRHLAVGPCAEISEKRKQDLEGLQAVRGSSGARLK